jgi:hypothetical protein|eukprot:COSAG06_NODE_8498_length_2148_cov_129.127867_3_plen_134_part_00
MGSKPVIAFRGLTAAVSVDRVCGSVFLCLCVDNPWDQATKGGLPRNETAAAITDAHRMTAILKETNADGVFGDGNGGGNGVMSRFYQGGIDAKHPAALQAESGVRLCRLSARIFQRHLTVCDGRVAHRALKIA